MKTRILALVVLGALAVGLVAAPVSAYVPPVQRCVGPPPCAKNVASPAPTPYRPFPSFPIK
jgi:hypothetical protein